MNIIFSVIFPSANGTLVVEGNISINNSTNNFASITTTADKVRIVASFYPIFEFVKKVGGDRVKVSSLIPVGIEPHDFEPTIQQIQNAETADMLVCCFEGQRIKNMNAKFVIDTSEGLNLTASTDGHTQDDGRNEASFDPHIWLDPLLAKQQVEKIRDGLIKIDPTNTAYT